MKYAIVEISGRQFWIETGKYYDFNRIPTDLGKQITLNRVLLLNNEGDVLVSRYHNDTLFQDSVKLFESYKLIGEQCKYKGFSGLKKLAENYQCYFILPDQYSKLVAFELMNIGLPVILPSENLLLHLSRLPNYWFGSGINKSTVNLCEWYNEYYDKFAIYIDDFSDIPNAFDTIVNHKKEICDIMKGCGDSHRKKTLDQWRKIYNV